MPEVDDQRSVPGQGLVRTDLVVLAAVGLGVLDQGKDVVDLLEEQSFVLQRAEPAFAGPVLLRGASSGADVALLGMAGDEVFESE